MNLNKVFLMGRVTADPELRTTPTGQSVVTITIATNRNWVGKNGQRQEDVQFHNVVVWGRQAEIVGQFLKKGSLVYVEGRLQNRKWQDAQGQTRRVTEIVAERVQLGPRAGGGRDDSAGSQGKFSRGNDFSDGKTDAQPQKSYGIDDGAKESLPEINMDDDEIKPEDIPF